MFKSSLRFRSVMPVEHNRESGSCAVSIETRTKRFRQGKEIPSRSGNRLRSEMNTRHIILLFGALVWFGATFWLAVRGTFVSSQDEPPLALAVAFLTPILLFLVSLQIPGWRALVVSIPPVLLIALNGWRYRLGLLDGLPGGAFTR